MVENLVCYIKKTYPKLYDIFKENRILRNIYLLPSRIYMKRRRKSIQEHGYDVIEMIYRISKELKIDIWIDGGTLLGYVREGELLKHDYDIDFGVYSLNELERHHLHEVFEKNGCTIVRGVADGKVQYSDSFEYKGVIFDLNYYFMDCGYSFYYIHDVNEKMGSRIIIGKHNGLKVTYVQGCERYKCIVHDNGVEDGKFLNGCPCIIPVNEIKRIEEIFGLGWKIPIVENYDWRKDNIVEYLGFFEDIQSWIIK